MRYDSKSLALIDFVDVFHNSGAKVQKSWKGLGGSRGSIRSIGSRDSIGSRGSVRSIDSSGLAGLRD